MLASLLATRATSLNAKVGAVTLALAGLMTLLLSHTAVSLAPLRIGTLAVAAFAAWAFCDEMGLGKPLNRAGFVAFAIAAMTKVQLVLGLESQVAGRYNLLYATFLLMAVLFWSVAFLHRKRELKIVGAVGVFATLLPIAAIIAGHVAVGLGAALGVESILAASEGSIRGDLGFVTLVERVFGLWGYVAAWLLWRGHIARQAS